MNVNHPLSENKHPAEGNRRLTEAVSGGTRTDEAGRVGHDTDDSDFIVAFFQTLARKTCPTGRGRYVMCDAEPRNESQEDPRTSISVCVCVCVCLTCSDRDDEFFVVALHV